jgi:hypothetical protein
MTTGKTKWLAAGAAVGFPLLPVAILVCAGVLRDPRERPMKLLPPEPLSLMGIPGLDWLVGDQYEVVVTRGGVSQTCRGKLLRIDDRWLVLREYETNAFVETSWARSLPVIGPWFYRTVDVMCQGDRWIGREAMTLRARWRGRKMPLSLGWSDPEPAMPAQYTISFVRDGAMEELVGSLLAIAGDDFTFESDAGARLTIARDEILSISTFSSQCSRPEEAE